MIYDIYKIYMIIMKISLELRRIWSLLIGSRFVREFKVSDYASDFSFAKKYQTVTRLEVNDDVTVKH